MYKRAAKISDNEMSDNENFFSWEQEGSIPNSADRFDKYRDVGANEEATFQFHMVNACMTGHLEIVREYLRSHNVNDFLHTGWTPLLYAASYAQLEVIEYLVANEADVNKHKDGFTPLMAICSSTKGTSERRIKCTISLIEAKAIVNAGNKQRQTPLMYACASQESELVAELIKYTKNVNACDNRNQTALMYAVIANKVDNVKILVENAADVTLTDQSNLTAKDIASTKGYNKILPMLNINDEEIINVCETSNINDWTDIFPSLAIVNDQIVDFDVFTMLYGMGLETYAHIFQGMSVKDFLALTENDLDSLGVEINAHRIQFMEQLHKFHRKKWSIQSIGVINKSLPYTLFNGIVSLGTVAKQLAVIGSSFQYIKNSLSKANTENIYLNNEQVSDYEQELKQIRHTLDVLKNELSQVKTLSKMIEKKNHIGIPQTYIGPRKRSLYWPILLSVTAFMGVYLSRTVYAQKMYDLVLRK